MVDLPAELEEIADDRDRIFCEEYVRCLDPLVAVIRARLTGGEAPEVTARQMMARPEIKATIAIMEKIGSADPDIRPTRESIAAQMDVVYIDAMNGKDFRSAIAAKRLQAELMGVLEQRVVVDMRKSVVDMTTEELERLIARKSKNVIDVVPDAGPGEPKTTFIQRALAGRGRGRAAEPPEG